MAHDADVFRERFLGFHPKLYRIAFALLGRAEDAEDAVQDLYLKLWTKRRELEHIRQAEAYCITLLKNQCLDILRSPKANKRESIEEVFSLSSDKRPDKAVEEKEALSIVQQLIGELPENQQQALRLQSIESCSVEEIEKAMGLTSSNIRTLLSRARKTIRNEFNKRYSS